MDPLNVLSNLVDFSEWDIAEYMAAICLISNIFIFTPIMLICSCKFIRRRYKTEYMRYFQTRNIGLIKFWLFCNFYYVSIHVMLLYVIQNYFEGTYWEDYFAGYVIISFVLCIFALRYWILYFDYFFNMSQLDLIWKRQINAGYSNWFLSHKQFGSAKFCFFAICLPFYILLNAAL